MEFSYYAHKTALLEWSIMKSNHTYHHTFHQYSKHATYDDRNLFSWIINIFILKYTLFAIVDNLLICILVS